MYSRSHIRINTTKEATVFVSQLNSDSTADKYVIEDASGSQRVNARSLLGVIYAMTEYCDEMYLVNMTNNGVYPSFIDNLRV